MTPTETYDKSIAMSKTSRPNSDDEDDDNDHAGEEDVTARLDRRLGTKSPSENIAALQRVKSLAQRNRMVSPLRFPLTPAHCVPSSTSTCMVYSWHPSDLPILDFHWCWYLNSKMLSQRLYAIQIALHSKLIMMVGIR